MKFRDWIGGVQEEIEGLEISLRSTVLIQLSGEGQFKPTEIKQEVDVGKKKMLRELDGSNLMGHCKP